MKVKVIKLDDRIADYAPTEEKERVGKVYKALKYHNEYDADERYHDWYVIGLENCAWHIPAFCCEVVEEEPTIEEFKESLKTKQWEVIPPQDRVLLVEDGSVDTTELEELGIKYIVYRSGARPPEWL